METRVCSKVGKILLQEGKCIYWPAVSPRRVILLFIVFSLELVLIPSSKLDLSGFLFDSSFAFVLVFV